MTELLNRYSAQVEQALEDCVSAVGTKYDLLIEAMRYSLMAGGKRLRPLLVLEFCRVCGGDAIKALPFACAVEMIHTYSLIHDDLPCMDDDDLRRGRPSCHKVYGEDVALLAGDALQSLAFETVANADLPADRIVSAVGSLSSFCGMHGMVGGQMMDISQDGNKPSVEDIIKVYSLKTSALLKTACEMGCFAAGKPEYRLAADEFAENLGLAFQIRDDILDIIGDQSLIGKAVGSDDKNDKSTVVARLGLEKANQMVTDYSNKACAALDCFGEEAADLIELTKYLVMRDH